MAGLLGLSQALDLGQDQVWTEHDLGAVHDLGTVGGTDDPG